MATLMKASNQWSTRPDDERFTSLPAMAAHFDAMRANSREVTVSSRAITAQPAGTDHKGLELLSPNGHPFGVSHWAFGQVSQLAEAPAGYLRTMPAPIAADCINYGLKFKRNIEDVGLLLYKNGDAVVRAATGPKYGRIWNGEIVSTLIKYVGDGVTGDWRVPGEFGKAVTVNKKNTTLYAGDRDMFVFLADEQNRIEVPNRRNGQPGSLARGFFLWNSEVGSSTFGLGTFLFDYVCMNRIVWGAEGYTEIKIRHTAGAPDRWLQDVRPALDAYARSSAKSISDSVVKAQLAVLKADDVEKFLSERFGKRLAQPIMMTHRTEEGRPIESLWDVATAATAYARGIEYQDERVAIERKAGAVMAMAA